MLAHLKTPCTIIRQKRRIIIMIRMILFCLGQCLPRPAHISDPPSQDRQHSSWSLSNLQTTLCTAHQEEKEQQSASSLCCVQVLFALYTVLIIWCAVVCAIVVLPPMSGVIQCAVCIIQCAMCIIQDGQHPPQSFSVLGASVLR